MIANALGIISGQFYALCEGTQLRISGTQIVAAGMLTK